jgi:hypothetical protein
VILLNYFVKIIYRSNIDITSVVGTPSIPSTPCDDPTLFTRCREEALSET